MDNQYTLPKQPGTILFFALIILAGSAVKCDDGSNYYVVEVPVDDMTAKQVRKPFNVYWNVPTMQCRSKKIPFANLFEKYGIVQNGDDRFRGDAVTILYDPGLFPALLQNGTSGKYRFRNGGVPQEGNITTHLEAFRLTMEQSIPDVDFEGVGIIDFESWRPIFRQNFGVLVPYKNVSVLIEKKLHWWWPDTWLQQEAKQRFENAASVFMTSTLTLAKQMRPKALWGYYGYPYCFNIATNNPNESCPANVVQENNQINWLWSESTALYPSLYSSKNLTSKQLAALVRGRVAEASRVRRKGTPIIPYFWFRYRDGGFLSELDLHTALETLYKSNASGFLIWGSSNDVNTVDKCNQLQNYVNDTLGPAIAKYAKYTPRIVFDSTTYSPDFVTETVTTDTTLNNLSNDSNENVPEATSTTYSPTFALTEFNHNESFTSKPYYDEISLKPDIQRISSNIHSQDVVKDVEEEFNKQSELSSTSNIKHIDDFKENVLKEILLNVFSNSKAYTKMDTNRDLASTENSVSDKLHYTSVPFVYYISTSNLPVLKLNRKNPIFDINEKTKVSTLADIILTRYTQNMDEAEATSVTTESGRNVSGDIMTDMSDVVNDNAEISTKYNEFTTPNITFAVYRHTTSTDDKREDKSTAQNEYMEYDSDLTTATQISSTTNDILNHNTHVLNVDVTRSGTDSMDNDPCNYTIVLDANDETSVETIVTTDEVNGLTTKEVNSVTRDEVSSSTTGEINSLTTDKVNNVTKIAPNTTSKTNLLANMSTSTSFDYDFFKLLHEEDNEEGSSPQQTKNLPITTEIVASKDATSAALYDDVSEMSTIENLEDESSLNVDLNELAEESLPSTSTPDKEVVLTL